MPETALLATLVPLAWLAGAIPVARVSYQALRPSKVPLCSKDHMLHRPGCYRQPSGGCDTTAAALALAAITGAIWPLLAAFLPFYALCVGLRYAITGRTPELPAEKDARLQKDIREVDDA